MKSLSQKQTIREHLLDKKTITPWEALGVYRVMRLASRIEELRREGMKIVTCMKQDRTGTKYAEYRLVKS